MKLKKKITNRGFSLFEFTDMNSVECSLQKSSLATDDAIWLGVSRANPRILIRGKGWEDYFMPEDVLIPTRMHLTREQVAALLPTLQFFVDTGDLPLLKNDEVEEGR